MTIHGKVRAAFAAQVLLIAIMAAAALISYQDFKVAAGNLDLVRQADILESECRRHEKDFIIDNTAAEGEQVLKTGKELQSILQNLIEESTGRGSEEIRRVTASVTEYLGAFERLKQIDEKIGLTDDLGLRGHMREKVHAAEAELKKMKDPALLIGMLTLRRHEKDFLIRDEAQYPQKHAAAAAEFFRALESAELPNELRESIRATVTDYIASFNTLVAEKGKFNIALKTANDASHASDPMFANMVTTFENSMNATRRLASLLIVIIAIAALVIGSTTGWVISARLKWILTQLSESIASGSEQVASACKQVAAASQQLASGASEQASSIEETSSSLEEMSSMVKQNAGNALQARGLAEVVRNAAGAGEKVMDEMNRAMADIKVASDDVGKIIKTIDEIAFQTNLLALNASVEAARAGDAGRGFAVVADEVRNLAQRAASAAKESAAKIETSVAKSKVGVETAVKVGAALSEISLNVRKTDDLISEISAASQEQSQGIAQVNIAVQQMDKVVQSNAANAEETASASEELSAQAESLRDAVDVLVGSASSGEKLRAKARTEASAPFRMSPINGNGLHSQIRATPTLEQSRKHADKSIPMGELAGNDEFKRF
jgi:methyl-accepting chemotaxis protein